MAAHNITEVVCINLEHRTDKKSMFIHDMPLVLKDGFRMMQAVNGYNLDPPSWWIAGGGAWGCYRSHLSIIEDWINRGVSAGIVLEDDAIPVANFDTLYHEYMSNLPSDWGLAYLGGQLLFEHEHPPKRISEHVYKPFDVHRTHAYAIRQPMMSDVYKWLCESNKWKMGNHIDHHLGRFQQKAETGVYCPAKWLFHQRTAISDLTGKLKNYQHWNDPVHVAGDEPGVRLGTESEIAPKIKKLLEGPENVEALQQYVRDQNKRRKIVFVPDHPTIHEAFPKVV